MGWIRYYQDKYVKYHRDLQGRAMVVIVPTA